MSYDRKRPRRPRNMLFLLKSENYRPNALNVPTKPSSHLNVVIFKFKWIKKQSTNVAGNLSTRPQQVWTYWNEMVGACKMGKQLWILYHRRAYSAWIVFFTSCWEMFAFHMFVAWIVGRSCINKSVSGIFAMIQTEPQQLHCGNMVTNYISSSTKFHTCAQSFWFSCHKKLQNILKSHTESQLGEL